GRGVRRGGSAGRATGGKKQKDALARQHGRAGLQSRKLGERRGLPTRGTSPRATTDPDGWRQRTTGWSHGPPRDQKRATSSRRPEHLGQREESACRRSGRGTESRIPPAFPEGRANGRRASAEGVGGGTRPNFGNTASRRAGSGGCRLGRRPDRARPTAGGRSIAVTWAGPLPSADCEQGPSVGTEIVRERVDPSALRLDPPSGPSVRKKREANPARGEPFSRPSAGLLSAGDFPCRALLLGSG
ncbi:hypothetical protein THAOC_35258, partial [Thalassiosira oceanica]